MPLRNVPIRQKLMLIALMTTGGTLLFAGAALIFFNAERFRQEMKVDLTSLAQIVAQNSTAALSFRDRTAAAETLHALSARQPIVAAGLYEKNGRLLAGYQRRPGVELPPRPARDGVDFGADGLVVFHPVELKGERIGTVYLRSDLSELTARIEVQALTVGTVFLASALAALLLSSRLQRLVSRPILALPRTARAVSERQDYSLRAAKRGGDELGQLVDAFNQMLGQIQQRDSALQEAKEELERRGEERTRELARRNEELHQSNKELDDFAYIASHDLKEPLRGIHNFSNFLLEDYADKLDDEGRSKLETLGRLSRRMEPLIVSLLQFSRPGRLDLPTDRVDLNEIVAGVLGPPATTLQE